MRRQTIARRMLIFVLAFMMMFPMAAMDSYAAVGTLSNVSTGLTGNIDTEDTVALPIKILDYEADGMLFEYAESNAFDRNDKDDDDVTGHDPQKAGEFGATWSADFANQTAVGNITNSMYGDFWNYTIKTLNTSNSYASFLRTTWAKNSTQAPHTGFGRSGAGVIMPNDLDLSMDNARYLLMVYRSNVTSGKIGFFVERKNADRTNTNNRVGDLTFTSEGTTNWTYAIYDLKQGNLSNTWNSYGNAIAIWTTLPLDEKGDYMDIAHVALFADRDKAEAFAEYALTDGSDRGDNRGFGLLRSSRNQANTNNYDGVMDKTTTLKQVNTYNATEPYDYSQITNLGYTLLGSLEPSAITNVGMLESSLSDEGYPVYKREVVAYMAELLQHSLEIPERTTDGWKNYRYVKGTASSIYGGTDLATALRNRINKKMGTYDEAAGKDLVGTWAEVSGNISSYYDAAYFLLNSVFVEGSYNELQADYNYLALSAGTDSETGDKVYVFDGGFTTSATPASASPAVGYDKEKHVIQNTGAVGKTHFAYEVSNGKDMTTTLNPFLPIINKNTEAGMTINPYYQDDGVVNTVNKATTKDTLYKRNFNFVAVSEGEFVYHADDELYFDFEGDDDVYLFINNELVLDIGSAHSIDKIHINLNDYVNAAKEGTLGNDLRNERLSLEEGDTYSFKFYYMERHSYGANMRIDTNIKVTDPSMSTAKKAWQDNQQLDFGSIVNKDGIVEYGFSMTNSGDEKLYNLTFADTDIGVAMNREDGLKVTGSRVYDVNGGTLEASDLTALITHPDYDDITVTFADNNALKLFLDVFTAEGTVAEEGLFANATVEIRGIGYKLSESQIAAGVFDNTVHTTATNTTESKILQGQATMRVFVPADPMYYQWAKHDLKVSKSKLIEDILAAARQENNLLAGKVPNLTTSNVNSIEITTKAGNTISSKYVTIDSSYNLNINYDTAGSKVFYVKITYNSNAKGVVVPVLVNVTDVKDSVYVLDYGLNADLTSNLFKEDAISVPGRNTKSSIIAVGNNGAYSPNEITFTKDSDGVVNGVDGTFMLSGQTLSYQPKDFMEGIDTVQVALNVYESDSTPSNINGTLNISDEVEMYKNVRVLPATVVYYEDDFPAIDYKETANVIIEDGYGTNLDSSSVNRPSQGVDPDENYGHDEVYTVNTNISSSAGTLTTITIKDTNTVAEFEFKGTGFEIIGRTDAENSGIIVVRVYDGSKLIKTIPVVTEFDNHYNGDGGDEKVHQVPVVRVNNLPMDGENTKTYRVEISGIPKSDLTKDEDGNYTNIDEATGKPAVLDSYLYVDGIRIYQSLGDENENYSPDENGAAFTEIRKLIKAGTVAVVEWVSDGETVISSGLQTWVENIIAEDDENPEGVETSITQNVVTSIDDYMVKGPNNEVYLEGTFTEQALMFYVKENAETAKVDGETDVPAVPNKEAYNLQISMRGIDTGLFLGVGSTGVEALVEYATLVEETVVENDTKTIHKSIVWTPITTLVSSTEQYYTIDYSKCPYDEEKGYQVTIRVTDPDFVDGVATEDDKDNSMVSFSTIKMNGLEFASNEFGTATDFEFINGLQEIVVENSIMTTEYEEEDDDTTPPDEGGDDDVTPPEEGGDDDATPPEEGGADDATPPEEGGDDDATPPEEGGDDDATPPDEGGDDDATPPEEGGDDGTPPEEGGDDDATPPEEGGDDGTPPDGDDNGDDVILPDDDDKLLPDGGGESPSDGNGGAE